jgi:hypothetical protein
MEEEVARVAGSRRVPQGPPARRGPAVRERSRERAVTVDSLRAPAARARLVPWAVEATRGDPAAVVAARRLAGEQGARVLARLEVRAGR